jgi:benzoyl-CoA reductase/2-hydroxyglutaryl-CoA dehydratase subunit BcrC/BadD/HgdB
MARLRVGITSTIPIEVIYASGSTVMDLNNIFIQHEDSLSLIEQAERSGFAESSCAWIKGIYSCVHLHGLDRVIAVTEGDCSNTHALMEALETEGIHTIPFMYPYDRDKRFLDLQLDKLCRMFGVGQEEVGSAKAQLDEIRRKVHRIDRLSWEDGLVTGFENHYYQICCSDMVGDPERFGQEVDDFMVSARGRKGLKHDVRLGYIGIPPIIDGIYEFIESQGGLVVYNELQRQFSMPNQCEDIVEQYLLYTYPYHIRFRLEDIKEEIGKRRIDGIIHYVQAFCFRQIEDIIIRKQVDIPVLTLEGNRPGRIDLRSRLRIEAFLDMLRSLKTRR